MNNNQNTQLNYKVVRASRDQADIIFEKFYRNTEQKNLSVVFTAVDTNENIVGYLVAEEKTVPPPLNGNDWFIWNIYTLPEVRRYGIGSALLRETIKQAKQQNIRHLQGSCTNTPAHLFWLKNGFCFQKYGQKFDDVNRPQEYGNYSHMIFYRINRAEEKQKKHENYQIIKAEREQLNNIFDEYILDKSIPLFKDKKDNIFGLNAVDNDGKVVGFITACPDELGAPLNGVQWLIPYIFVNSEFRRRGIGSALLKEMIQAAKEEGIAQLGLIRLDEEMIAFLYNNNFDICVWYIMGGSVKPVSAAICIK